MGIKELAIGGFAALGVATCSPHDRDALAPAAPPAPTVAVVPAAPLPPAAEAVVLVTFDGVRWQDVFDDGAEARLPNVYGLARRGAAIGAPGHGAIVASGPSFVSLPGYVEILTGHRAACADNDCPGVDRETLVDELRADGDDVAVFASWERIARAAARRNDGFALSTGRSVAHDVDPKLLAEGAAVGPWPGGGDFRPDRFTARAALTHLETRRPRFLFLSLGDTDEYAHHGDRDGYLNALRESDRVVGELVATLGRMGERGQHTTVIVTTDHGRAESFRDHGGAWPESARVWLVAAGAGIPTRGFARSEETRALADLAPTVRALLGVREPARRPGDGVFLDELLGSAAR